MKNLYTHTLNYVPLLAMATFIMSCHSEHDQATDRAAFSAKTTESIEKNSPTKITIEVERPETLEFPVANQAVDIAPLESVEFAPGPGIGQELPFAEPVIPISPATTPWAFAQSPFFNDGSVPAHFAHLIGKYGLLPSRYGNSPPFLYSLDADNRDDDGF